MMGTEGPDSAAPDPRASSPFAETGDQVVVSSLSLEHLGTRIWLGSAFGKKPRIS